MPWVSKLCLILSVPVLSHIVMHSSEKTTGLKCGLDVSITTGIRKSDPDRVVVQIVKVEQCKLVCYMSR